MTSTPTHMPSGLPPVPIVQPNDDPAGHPGGQARVFVPEGLRYLTGDGVEKLAADALALLSPASKNVVIRAAVGQLPANSRTLLTRDLLSILSTDERAAVIAQFTGD